MTDDRALRVAQKDAHHLKRLGGIEQGRRNTALHTERLKEIAGATPAVQFEARIFPESPWPVEIETLVEHPLDWGFPGPVPIYRCRRLDAGELIWVRANNLFILPNAPERSAS